MTELRTRADQVARSSRTRWLVFIGPKGQPTAAPGVRTFQLALLFGMGRDWYERAMALPVEREPVPEDGPRITALVHPDVLAQAQSIMAEHTAGAVVGEP